MVGWTAWAGRPAPFSLARNWHCQVGKLFEAADAKMPSSLKIIMSTFHFIFLLKHGKMRKRLID